MRGRQTLTMACMLVGAGFAGCSSTPEIPRESQVPSMQCGQADIALDLNEDGDWLELTHLDNVIELQRVTSASGARYESTENNDTWFWNKGIEATLTLDGATYPTCLAAGGVAKPFNATGNEPFWRVIVEPGQLVLERPDHPVAEMRYETVARSRTGRRFRASEPELSVDMVTAPQLCRDSMTGMPHPFQVRLSINGEALTGCGGDPGRLLMGDEWVIEDIGGRGIVDRSRVTVQFLPEGRVIGSGSCNRYMGNWSMNGEAIGVKQLAATLKACPPALMNQEDRFLKQLESIRRFDFSSRGALLLISDEGEPLRASKATQ